MKNRLLIGFVLSALILTNLILPMGASYAEEKDNSNNNNNNNNNIIIQQPQEEKKDPLEILKKYAQEKGGEYGKMFAGRDYMQGLKDDPKRHFSDAASVYSYFKMSSDASTHKKIFFDAFIEAYRFAYEEAYIDISMNDRDDNETYWFQVAKQAGEIEGTISAYYDHLNENGKNWDLAYKRFIENESLTERFRLNRFTSRLPNNFELDFKLVFKRSYENAYAKAIVEENQRNTNYYYVDAEGNDITYQREYAEVSKGSQSSKPMPTMEIIFPKRSVHERTPIALRYKQHRSKVVQPYLVPLSDIYEVELQREVKSVVFHEEPTLKMTGYAVRGAGIYKWNHNRWDYIMTTITDKELIANLPKGTFKNTEYAVFIDDNYSPPTDISFNWAFKEIYTYMRRHNVPQLQKFYPEVKISRLDLADILYRTMNHRVRRSNSNTYINDEHDISYGLESVRFCLDMGYMLLDNNSNFNPKAKVSYFDFQTMMKRLNPAYSLEDHVNKQLNEKFYRSDLLTKKDSNISRSEVVFALYEYVD